MCESWCWLLVAPYLGYWLEPLDVLELFYSLVASRHLGFLQTRQTCITFYDLSQKSCSVALHYILLGMSKSQAGLDLREGDIYPYHATGEGFAVMF